MKHIFFVSSNLTFFIANKIIQSDGLQKEQCCLFLVRNYQVPFEYSNEYPHQISTNYNVDPRTGRIFEGIKFWKTYKNICYFDHLIDEFIQNDSFIWYSSVCSNDICSLMVSRKECEGYYIIEDGLASYRNFNPQTFVGWRYWMYKCVLKPLYPRIFCVKNHFITTNHPKFRGCIATSHRCFPLHQAYLRVIGNPFDKAVANQLPDAVISIDPWYSSLDISVIDGVYKAIAGYIAKKNYKNLACKFHPRFEAPQNFTIKKEYTSILKRYFPTIKILSKDIILEQILVSPNQDFYCGVSSVPLYVSLSGVKCYTYMPLVKGTQVWEDVQDVLRDTMIDITSLS